MGERFKTTAKLLAGTGLCLSAVNLAHASPDLSGFWKLDAQSSAHAPLLTPWGKHNRAKSGTDADVEAVRWCVMQGMPFVMTQGGDLDIIQAPNEIAILGERSALPRHIYTSVLAHPDPAGFDNSPTGDSRGRWVGDVLVADTVGFADGVGPVGIPRTASSHLTERFTASGDKLKVVSTWSDRKTLKKPYVYTSTYKRMLSSYYPEEQYCDPRKNGVVQ